MPADTTAHQQPSSLPRILCVSRRSVRKNKYIDFVGEYHLDLLVQYGACPVIVPRVEHVSHLLDAFEPIHGVLLAEGEDISPDFRPCHRVADREAPDASTLAAIASAHPGDTTLDHEKDRIEFDLVRRCLARGIPYLGICRGSQILNIAAGGSVLVDIDTEVPAPCKHIDYANYDAHRHPVAVAPATPLADWFDGADSLSVNSYHHQGVKSLADRFVPMAHSPDGLIEAFYDPRCYAPKKGNFCVGLQFHPERMQDTECALGGAKASYDYPGCPRPYEAFVSAAKAYQQKSVLERVPRAPNVLTAKTEDRAVCRRNGTVELVPRKGAARMDGFDAAGHRMRGAENKQSDKRDIWDRPTGRPYEYSKEDLQRLLRSGATVHGARLAYKLLQGHDDENNAPNSLNSLGGDEDKNDGLRDWKLFCRGLRQAEKYVRRLRGTGDGKRAAELVRRLQESCLMP